MSYSAVRDLALLEIAEGIMFLVTLMIIIIIITIIIRLSGTNLLFEKCSELSDSSRVAQLQ